MNVHSLNEELLSEAVEFFTSTPGFSRLFKGMARKYQSLGRWGGSVTLSPLKAEEKEALSTFFRQDYSHQQSATISLERFAQALAETRFAEISVLTLMEKLQGRPLVSKAETLAQKEQAKRAFFEELDRQFDDPYSQSWLRALQEKQPGTRLVHQLYEKAPDQLSWLMLQVLNALQELAQRSKPSESSQSEYSQSEHLELPDRSVRSEQSELSERLDRSIQKLDRLPVFARHITKDPHGFDPDTDRGKLLISALRLLAQSGITQTEITQTGLTQKGTTPIGSNGTLADPFSPSNPAEELTELYFSFGLLRDDLWNFVTCTGILATSEEGKPVHYLSEGYLEGATFNLPLREIVKLAEVTVGKETAEPVAELRSGLKVKGDMRKFVFVVENSGVFSALLDYWENPEALQAFSAPNPPLICTHGQFKLAGLLLLEKLAASGATLYYSGDFDPEGLLMADRLLKRYPGQVKVWHYRPEDYRTSLSEQRLSLSRMKKLDSVTSPELLEVKEEILRVGLAGYQEGILELLWQDILEFMKL